MRPRGNLQRSCVDAWAEPVEEETQNAALEKAKSLGLSAEEIKLIKAT
jgi:hypothetical protein